MTERDVDSAPWQVTPAPASVTAWNRQRLPFAPRGEIADYRNAIRRDLRSLTGGSGRALTATYWSPDDGFVDAENAALYNIGSGAYSHLVAGGLYCERRTSPDDKHHLTYSLGLLPDPPGTHALLRIRAAVPRDLHRPGPWWAVFRPVVLSAPSVSLLDGPFALDVTLLGNWTPTGMAGVVKPLLDGLVSSLHQHDGGNRDLLLPRITELGEVTTAWLMLCDSRQNILGGRKLVRPHGSSYAWNPADERCHAFRIHSDPAEEPGVIAELRSLPGAEDSS